MCDEIKTIPQWLDEEFMKSVLQKKYPEEDVKIMQMNVKMACKPGENFASVVLRVSVDSSRGSHHFIVKLGHTDAVRKNLLEPYELFKKEVDFYTKYWPAMEKLLESVNENELIVPEVFWCDSQNETIILEDLSARGFFIGNHKTRVPRDALEICLRKLAKIHAASLVFNGQKNGNEVLENPYNNFRFKGPFQEGFAHNAVAFAEEVSSWGCEFEAIARKLEIISKDYLKLADRVSLSSRGLNVLLHGDLWYNNLLLHTEDDGGPFDDVCLIDFQSAVWGSLALDLIYFIFTSFVEEDYQKNVYYWVSIYYTTFYRVLEKLKYSPLPELDNVKQEVKDKLFHGLFAGGFAKSSLGGVDPEDLTLEQFVDDNIGSLRRKFQHPRVQNELKYILKFIDQEGALVVNLMN